MSLFTNTVVDKGLASLFGKPAKKDELVESRKDIKENKKETKENRTESEQGPKQESDSESEEGEIDLEDVYVKKRAGKEVQSEPKAVKSTPKESVKRSAHEDDEHTIFIKNVPNAVMTDRKALREFKKLFGPGIQSLRFRSIAMSEVVPRKVAFIKQKLHPSRDAVNCYIVYKDKERMSEVLTSLNCTEFLGHHLLVDSASKPREQAPKKSIFIGNLSFEATEEQLYQHFVECGPIENLRIVRDRKFNVGKGFAYIQFDDVSTVQVALLQNGKQLDGRELRVSRCSTKETKKKNVNSFREKQTDRSRKGNPKKKASKETKGVLEGERAKPGDVIPLNKKRRNTGSGRPRKMQRK